MNLREKLRQLQNAAKKSGREAELEKQLEVLQRLEEGRHGVIPLCGMPRARKLPAQRMPHGVEEYVNGRVENHALGEYFLAEEALPFGRPYGKTRIGDISAADLSPLNLFFGGLALPCPSRLVYLDTETTGLTEDACAFLIGIGFVEGTRFVVRQFFLRDNSEERAVLAALAETLAAYDGLLTFNGKTFDVPLLETRYSQARLISPFNRLLHLDLLHPARQLWKLRLERCQLTNLEKYVLGIAREGDVPGSEIPGIYFDYLRTGDAGGLQPVFFHNALDIISLAALAVEVARVIAAAGDEGDSMALGAPLDLLSLSRIFERAGASDLSVSTCRRALAAGLPELVEPLALWRLAAQHKRRQEFNDAVEIWLKLTRREEFCAIQAYHELAIHYEHRQRDAKAALEFTEAAIERLMQDSFPSLGENRRSLRLEHFSHRRARLQKRIAIQQR